MCESQWHQSWIKAVIVIVGINWSNIGLTLNILFNILRTGVQMCKCSGAALLLDQQGQPARMAMLSLVGKAPGTCASLAHLCLRVPGGRCQAVRMPM